MQNNIPMGSPLEPYTPPAAPWAPGPVPPMLRIPQAPQVAPAAPVAPGKDVALPIAPPSRRKRLNMFDREHRSETLMALGTGLLSGGNDFGASMANAGKNFAELRKGWIDEQKPQKAEVGGPDNAFAVTHDPETGQPVFTPIAPAQEYLSKKRDGERADKAAPSFKDVVQLRGSVMEGILRVPAEFRAQAYAQFLQTNPGTAAQLGLPPQWDEQLGTVYRDAAMDPNQRMGLDVQQGRLLFDREKFQTEWPVRAANIQSTISSRTAAGARAERKDQRAAAKASAPPASVRRKGKGGSSSLPAGFKLD